MDFWSFFTIIAGIGALILALIILAVVGIAYYFLRNIVKPQAKLWLFVGLTALALIFVPDPLDLATGGIPAVEVMIGLFSAFKVLKNLG